MVCGFTGHRPQKLPWGSREEDPRCRAVKTMLARKLRQAAELGCLEFLCGMARGCDFYFAEAVLALQQEMPGISLRALVPCPEQAGAWPRAEQRRYEELLHRCSAVEILEPAYSEGCMLRRNREMVDRSQVLISIYDGSGGGTGSTVRYARERGLTILPVWL